MAPATGRESGNGRVDAFCGKEWGWESAWDERSWLVRAAPSKAERLAAGE